MTEYLKANCPGLCSICGDRIFVGDLIHLGKSVNIDIAAHHQCVQDDPKKAFEYGMTGGQS